MVVDGFLFVGIKRIHFSWYKSYLIIHYQIHNEPEMVEMEMLIGKNKEEKWGKAGGIGCCTNLARN